MLRHSAQTLLAPQEYDLKDFVQPVPEDVRGSFVGSVSALQGLVFIMEGKLESAKKHLQTLLKNTDNSMIKTISQLYLLQIALLEGDNERAEEYASFQGVKSFLTLKTADMQVIQAWYQFKVKKDEARTRKAMIVARQKMNASRMLRDEKAYYENWLAELEKELAEGV
jgi:peptidase family M50 family protein